MGLLVVKDLRAICNRAIAENLALNREPLFFGIAPAIMAIVRDQNSLPADALKAEANQLNQFDERTTDGFLLAIWLTNCADVLAAVKPAAAQYFQDWAATVDGLAPAKLLDTKDTEAIIQVARDEAATDDKVELALKQLESEIGALSRRATNLMLSKRLHDALHKIQVSVLPLWRRGINGMTDAAALWRPIVQDRQRALRAEAQSMAGEYTILAQGDPLRTMAQATVDSLIAATDKADAAIAANELVALPNILLAVRDVVKDDMRNYANRIEAIQEALDLKLLVQNLSLLADHATNEALVVSARRAASALAAILQDLDVIGPQHRLWQDLDIQIWLLEEQFYYLSMGPAAFAAFNYQWQKIVIAIDELAGQPPADWSVLVNQLRADFLAKCPHPVEKLPTAEATEKFEDFVLELRRTFQAIDQRLRDTCNLLREITVELAKI